MNTRSPPVKYTAGIDSIHLRFRGVNKYDLDRFCKQHGLKYKKIRAKLKYQQSWHIFLPGGQPITARYHSSSKSMKFEIGGLMNYSTNKEDHHSFTQNIVHFFGDRVLLVPRIDIAVDIKHPTRFKSSVKEKQDYKHYMSTLYHNRNGRTFTVYNKAKQLQIYSIHQLTRYELRLTGKLKDWQVRDFIENRNSLMCLADKAQQLFAREYTDYAKMGSLVQLPDLPPLDLVPIIENFIVFLHGEAIPSYKDHFKIAEAITRRDKFFQWMRTHELGTIAKVQQHIKGKRALAYSELGVTHKTFNKALSYYKGIPNFKVTLKR